MLCKDCGLIRASPDRDWPYQEMHGRDVARNPIGKVMTPLMCVECRSDWIRTVYTSTGDVHWTLIKEGE